MFTTALFSNHCPITAQQCCQYGKQNPPQFNTLAEKVLGDPSLVTNPKFATNDARVKNRTELVHIITDALMKHDKDHWLQIFTGLGFVGVHASPKGLTF